MLNYGAHEEHLLDGGDDQLDHYLHETEETSCCSCCIKHCVHLSLNYLLTTRLENEHAQEAESAAWIILLDVSLRFFVTVEVYCLR